MIDGKIFNWITDTAGQCCYICGAKPKEMNNLSNVSQKAINKNSLSLGISSLHVWIKVLECILHTAYRLDVEKWQIRQSEKEKIKDRNKRFKRNFEEKWVF